MHRSKWTKVVMLSAIALFAAAAPLAVSGCNTTAGVGRDIEAAGDALEDAAEAAND